VVTLVVQQIDIERWTELLAATEPSSANTASSQARTPPEKPRFQFYTLLPEMEVAVPEEELQAEAARPIPLKKPEKTVAAAVKSAEKIEPGSELKPTTQKPALKGQFLLQVGSFSKADDAERLKANLALIGLGAHIQTVQINGSDTWHRVRAGPFKDLASVNGARARLRANDMDAIVLKTRR